MPDIGFEGEIDNKQTILVLHNPSNHHGCNAEVRIPEGNSKGYNTELLRINKCKNISVGREVTVSEGVRSKKYVFMVPATWTFPQVNSKCGKGVKSPVVVLATRAFLNLKHPKKRTEKVDKFMNARGWCMIWTCWNVWNVPFTIPSSKMRNVGRWLMLLEDTVIWE